MKIILRLFMGAFLLCASSLFTPLPLMAADILQCVPYAREVSGVAIRGDAWTWWDQAKGRYQRGREPKPGAVIALANSDAMPLGHVAVVSRILDERRILVRHANWSAPGMIEDDVLAIDSSEDNDWSQVRIWWGQSQQMGARDNPVNGFIYPARTGRRPAFAEDAGDDEGRRMLADISAKPDRPRRAAAPRLKLDLSVLATRHDAAVTSGRGVRTLEDIIADVRVLARLR